MVCLEEERVVVIEKAVADGKNFAGDGSNRGPSVEFLKGCNSMDMPSHPGLACLPLSALGALARDTHMHTHTHTHTHARARTHCSCTCQHIIPEGASLWCCGHVRKDRRRPLLSIYCRVLQSLLLRRDIGEM